MIYLVDVAMVAYSNGHASFHWGIITPFACNVRWFLIQWSEGICSWLMAMLSAERMFALYFPLQHRKLTSLKVTYSLLGAVLLYSSAAALPSGLFARVWAVGAAGQNGCHVDLIGASWVQVLLMVFYSGFNEYVYAVLLSVLFSLLVVRKLVALN